MSLIIKFVLDDARSFTGRKTFIQILEQGLEKYYGDVAQHLRAWQPSPPKPKKTEHDGEHLEDDD